MKDSNDTSTIDIETQVKRGRGRPATGAAKTNADRQRAYRARKSQQWRDGLYSINLTLESNANFALKRLADHYGVSVSAVVGRLAIEADDLLISTMAYGSDEYENYLNVTHNA